MLVEELSEWECVYCQAKNDHTNGTRCWNCNKKKPKWSTVKRILSKRAKLAKTKKEEAKKEVIEKIDNVEPKPEVPLTFDTSKLELE